MLSRFSLATSGQQGAKDTESARQGQGTYFYRKHEFAEFHKYINKNN